MSLAMISAISGGLLLVLVLACVIALAYIASHSAVIGGHEGRAMVKRATLIRKVLIFLVVLLVVDFLVLIASSQSSVQPDSGFEPGANIH